MYANCTMFRASLSEVHRVHYNSLSKLFTSVDTGTMCIRFVYRFKKNIQEQATTAQITAQIKPGRNHQGTLAAQAFHS